MTEQERPQIVPSEWPIEGDSKIAFVGEAPGEEEVEQGRPFVGASGRLFNAMIRAADLNRKSCFVGNVFSFKLPENSTAELRKVVGEAEYKAIWSKEVGRLADELEAYQPNVIVALGNTPVHALCGSGNVGKLRGQLLYSGSEDFPYKFKVLPTFHPAYVLRTIKVYTVVTFDFVRAEAEARRGPEIIYPKRELILNPTIEEVEHYCQEWQNADLLSCDIETGWDLIRGVSFAPHAELALYVPFITLDRHDKNYWRDTATEVRAWKAVKGLLESDVPKLGQFFGGYDAVWLFKRAGIRVKNLRHDTRLLHHAIYAELPKSLGFMAATYSTQGAWKHWADHGGKRKDRGEKRDE